jgi:hypothetical protein
VKSSNPAAFLAMHRREISERAGLLRRLGYSRDEALRRCQAYEVGEYEPFARSPLAGEVAKLVDEVYHTKTGRVSTLSPGT